MTALRDWVRQGREKGASDLLLESGTQPVYRIRGELVPAGDAVAPDALLGMAREILGEERWEEFVTRRSADLSLTLAGTRCRVNLFQTVRGIGFAVRLLSSFQNNLSDCNLHPDLRRFTLPKSGLVVISGATGSGKSTTLAALIEEVNAHQRRHVIVLESPIEYFFTNRKSYIRQREIPHHAPSFEQAIVDSMRENPDLLVIGEMRTPDVMRLTLNAAETGHLVMATMHSSSCAEALARICMSFPAEVQSGIRAQLADSLVGVVCQRLDYLPQLQMRVPQCEILVANSAARSNIRAGQFSQLLSVLQAGGEEGMWTFERYQRWMEQKRDWVKSSQAAPLTEREPPAPAAAVELSAPASGAAPARRPTLPRARPAAVAPAQPAERARSDSGADGRIEIAPVEEDLEALARKISKS
jgi:twitching motility protein PilT